MSSSRARRRARRGDRALANTRRFRLDILGRVLLHMARPFERLLERMGAANARAHRQRRLAEQEFMRVEVGEDAIDEAERVVDRLGLLVPDRDLVAGARETDRPGAADKPKPTRAIFAIARPPDRNRGAKNLAGLASRRQRLRTQKARVWRRSAKVLSWRDDRSRDRRALRLHWRGRSRRRFGDDADAGLLRARRRRGPAARARRRLHRHAAPALRGAGLPLGAREAGGHASPNTGDAPKARPPSAGARARGSGC